MNKNYAKFEKPCVKKILDQLKIHLHVTISIKAEFIPVCVNTMSRRKDIRNYLREAIVAAQSGKG